MTQFNSGKHDHLSADLGFWHPYTPLTNPTNRLLEAFRLIDAGRGEYADWVRDIDANPHFWLREGGLYPQYTPAEHEHARKVLSRIPLAFPKGKD